MKIKKKKDLYILELVIFLFHKLFAKLLVFRKLKYDIRFW